MADLSLATDALVLRIAQSAGYDNPDATQRTWALKRLNDGYRRVVRGGYRDEEGRFHVHHWNFLRPWATLDLAATVDSNAMTGVYVSVTTITDTGAGAKFYENVVGRTITVSDVGDMVVAGYTDPDVVTVTGDHHWADLENVTIPHEGIYDLPADFGGLLSPFVYVPESGETLPDLTEGDPNGFQRWHRDNSDAGDDPTHFAVIPKTFVKADGQRWQALFWPPPDAARVVRYRYRRQVDVLTDSDSVYPVGGPDFVEALLHAGKAEAEKATIKASGPEEAAYNVRMMESVVADAVPYGSAGRIEQLTDIDVGM